VNDIGANSTVFPVRNPTAKKFGETVFYLKKPLQIETKNQVLDDILALLTKLDLMTDEMGIRLSLDEALSNSIIHGNKRDPHKNITIEVFYEGNRWGIIFEDEGEGFVPKVIPDFNDPETLLAEGGRGVFLMHHYMDTVVYCGRGNVIELTKTVVKEKNS